MQEQSIICNRLLSRLSPEDFALLSPHLQHVTAPQNAVLIEADARITEVFFPESGVLSIVIRSPAGEGAEAGLIGREGFIHPVLLLGSDSMPCSVEVQLPCRGYSLPSAAFMEAVEASSSLRSMMLRYAHAQMAQSMFTSLSYATHHVGVRLARWLLMCRDRIDEDVIALTHDALAIMLGVRRPSVTNAMHVLEGTGLLRADRGIITIRNRSALQAYAADAYGGPEAAYRQVLGPF